MKHHLKIWGILPVALLALGMTACDDGLDLEYKGNHSLSLLNLKQAVDVWTGAACNVTTTLRQNRVNGQVQEVDNFSYTLNLSLYQNAPAGQTVTVDLVVAADSLQKAIANVGTSSAYDVYNGAELLPESYYTLSATQMELAAGNTLSEDVTLTVRSNDLIALVQNERMANATFVLPLQIRNASAYEINTKTNTLMLFFNVTYVTPPSGPDYEADTEGVPDDHVLNGQVLTFHDEFNGTGKPDASVWRFEEGFQRNEELQWYCDRNAEMDGQGALVFTGKRERVENPNYDASSSDWKLNRPYAEYTSSCIVSNYRFNKGTMIVRAKIPTASGAWPAIWTTGTSDEGYTWEWPLGGEIDLLEFYLVNGVQSIHANYAWGSDTRWSARWDSYNCPLSEFTADDPEWADKYHIWRLEWDSENMRIYLDDRLMNEVATSATTNGSGGLSDWWRGAWRSPFNDEGNPGTNFGQQIFLNLALGSNGGTPALSQFPLYYYVDYVRVYQTPATGE